MVHEGKAHAYLGININYTRNNCVKFTMYDFIEDLLGEAMEDMHRTAVTLVSDNIFEIDNKSDPLSPNLADYFHQMTVRLLFVSKRVRLDIQLVIMFLCTRVRGPNKSEH